MSDDMKFNLKLEQLKLGELKNAQNIDNNKTENSEYLNYIELDNSDFFNKFDINILVKETEKKIKNDKKIVFFPTKILKAAATVAACFIIAINLFPILQNDNKEIIYLKGSQKLNIYLKDSDNIEQLNNFDKVYANNQLQITYKSNNNYGTIFSVDGINNITFHYPESLFSTTKLDIGKEVNLPSSYTLDNAPYFEKFYFVTSEESFDLNLVKNATLKIYIANGKIIEDLKLPKKYKIDTITLLKD